MLKSMRENLKSFHWVLWIVIGSFVISIFFWDTGVNWTGSLGSTWAATVNGERIPSDEYQRAFRDQVEFLRRAFGERWDPMYVEQVGMADQVVDSLVQREVALQEARRLGLGATPREIMTEVRQIPAFQDGDGNFVGLGRYKEVLRRNNLNVTSFEEDLDDQITFRKFQTLIRASVVVTDQEAEEALRRDRERVTIEYALFTPEAMGPVAEPTEEDLRSWYQENLDAFTGPELRRVRYVHLSQADALEAVADPEEMRAYYDEHQDRYTVPEGSRRARQILVRVSPTATDEERTAARDQARSLADRALAGEEFASLARNHSDELSSARDGGDMGWFAQGELMPPLDAALFELQEGDLEGPIETPMGFHVVQLTEIAEEERVRPFEEVRTEIGGILYFAAMQEWIARRAEAMQEDLEQEASLDDMAQTHRLEVREARVASGEGIRGLGSFPEVAEAIVSGEEGAVQGPFTVVDGEQVFLEVAGVVPAEPQPFEEVRAQVATSWKRARAMEAARVAAEAAAAELEDGAPLADAAAVHGIEAVTSDPFTRTGNLGGDLGRQPLLARRAFSLEKGEAGPLVETGTGIVVFTVTEREDLTPDQLEQERPTYRRYLESLRFQQVWDEALRRLAQDARVRVNNSFLEAVKREYIRRNTPEEGAPAAAPAQAAS